MFFSVSKLLWSLAQPSSAIFLLIVLGVLLSFTHRCSRLGRWMAVVGLVLMAVAGLGPTANMVILPLEQRFARSASAAPPPTAAGIIVLGGYEDGRLSQARGSLHMNEASERLTEAIRLARLLPSLPIVISGGAGTVVLEQKAGGGAVRDYLVAVGIDPARIKLEEKSLTTYENALFTRELVQPKPEQAWLLVTSASHMPRAVGSFRKQGFTVIPWPADFRTAGDSDWLRPMSSIPAGLKRLDEACMEWTGLAAYHWLGRTDTLFPAP